MLFTSPTRLFYGQLQLGKETATLKVPVCQFSSIGSVQSVSLEMANRGIPLQNGIPFPFCYQWKGKALFSKIEETLHIE